MSADPTTARPTLLFQSSQILPCLRELTLLHACRKGSGEAAPLGTKSWQQAAGRWETTTVFSSLPLPQPGLHRRSGARRLASWYDYPWIIWGAGITTIRMGLHYVYKHSSDSMGLGSSEGFLKSCARFLANKVYTRVTCKCLCGTVPHERPPNPNSRETRQRRRNDKRMGFWFYHGLWKTFNRGIIAGGKMFDPTAWTG